MQTDGDRDQLLRVVLILAGFFVILAGLKVSASIVGPFLLGVLFAVLFDILIIWLEDRNVPHLLALIISMVSFLAVVAGFFLVIVVSFVQLVAQLPENQAAIESSIGSIASLVGIELPPISGALSNVVSVSVSAFAGIVESVAAVAIIVITTLFLLVEARGFSRKITAGLSDSPEVLERVSILGEKVVRYIVIRTEVNMVIGVAIGLLLAALGLENAAFWGFVAFVLGFIPYLGFFMAVIPPTLIAWSELGPTSALIILAGAVIINTLVENVLFPQAAGKGLKVSPAVVFLSLIGWGFVLGGVGALLAVPLTIALIMFLQFFDETRWIGILLETEEELGLSPASPRGDGDSPPPAE
jgi:predicted PurR-regulated permease PerM